MPAIMSFPSPELTSFSDGHRGGWASESFMTSSVNGVTQTIHKRRDWDVRTFSFAIKQLDLISLFLSRVLNTLHARIQMGERSAQEMG